MSKEKKYKYILTFENGEEVDSTEDTLYPFGVFSSEEEARDAALYAISCAHEGAEIFNLTGDNDEDYDEDEDIDYIIEEIDE